MAPGPRQDTEEMSLLVLIFMKPQRETRHICSRCESTATCVISGIYSVCLCVVMVVCASKRKQRNKG